MLGEASGEEPVKQSNVHHGLGLAVQLERSLEIAGRECTPGHAPLRLPGKHLQHRDDAFWTDNAEPDFNGLA